MMLPRSVRVERSRDMVCSSKHLDFAQCERFGMTIWPHSLRAIPSRPQVIPDMFLTRRREATKDVIKEAASLCLRGFVRAQNSLEVKRFAANEEIQVLQS